MTQYRICPSGANGWKIQDKWLGLIWCDTLRLAGLNYYERIEFDTEADAEQWVWNMLAGEATVRDAENTARSRQEAIKPRVFP